MNSGELLTFLRSQRLAVQASCGPNATAQAALVGIAVTDAFELVFDTLSTTRKSGNIRARHGIAFVIGGWAPGDERTVQYEGIADEPTGLELERIKAAYFAVWPDGPSRSSWPGLTYFRVRPTWIRYSDFNSAPPVIQEFSTSDLILADWSSVPVFGAPPAATAAIVRPSAYGIVTDAQGRIAVVHTPVGLSLPGGGSDESEVPEVTVVRETREECGLDVRVGAWRRAAVEHVFSTAERVQFEKHNIFCDAIVLGNAGEPTEADHVLEWVSAGEAAARLVPASHRWAVTEWSRLTGEVTVPSPVARRTK
jgi:8-oxo-dGTP pyrophosphatase MutT (NUDIX family)